MEKDKETSEPDSSDIINDYIRVPLSTKEVLEYNKLRARWKPPEIDDEMFNRHLFLFGVEQFALTLEQQIKLEVEKLDDNQESES